MQRSAINRSYYGPKYINKNMVSQTKGNHSLETTDCADYIRDVFKKLEMPGQYKFTYFDLTGIGEPIRMLLHYGGIKFVDERIAKDDWPTLKPQTPLGQLPTLDVDGKTLFQSGAIARYVAAQVGLTGKTDLENWEIDAVVDTLNDLKTKITTWFFTTNETEKESLKETLDNEIIPFYLKKLDEWAAKNGGHLAVGKLTWADFVFAGLSEFLVYIYGSDFIVDYPNLVSVRRTVNSLPKVQAWVQHRPKDNYF